VDQYFPEAVFKQNQIIVNMRAQFSPRFGLMGFYNWTDANLGWRRRVQSIELLQSKPGLRTRKLCAAADGLRDGQLQRPLGTHV
jgi:hypothetical protein